MSAYGNSSIKSYFKTHEKVNDNIKIKDTRSSDKIIKLHRIHILQHYKKEDGVLL